MTAMDRKGFIRAGLVTGAGVALLGTGACAPGAPDRAGVRRIGWFDTAEPLLSGWSWGQPYLENGVAAFAADYGEGKMFIFGPKITFRAQSHGTFGLLFNGIYYGAVNQRPVSQ